MFVMITITCQLSIDLINPEFHANEAR
uniref:Uncharacterized protein n=1 Tax=Cyanidium caldarium TaxID=2771 RepID=Q9TLZ3_CYACA|nr:hypothetical protein JXY51_pgp097 [Cyanidium caldarium]AAF12970.1 unknown [Cyanidium caldarium]